MDLSEFIRRLGAEPGSRDPALRKARRAGPEFEAAARAAERFESVLGDAARLPVPDGLVDDLARARPARPNRRWPMALAAGLALAVIALAIAWRFDPGWDSVEDYVVSHYRHDGAALLAADGGVDPARVRSLLDAFRLAAPAALTDHIAVIKVCPTPSGRGIHMVLDTGGAPVTVIYMPGTEVDDRKQLAFDDLEALLVRLPSGSAAVIGHDVEAYYALVQDALRPARADS